MQRRDEDKLQAALWELIQLRKQPGVLAWAVCNNPRSAPDGARLKRLGMLPGVPDLHFLVPGGRYHTLEVKTVKGRPNPNQIAWMSNLNATGATADICRGWDDCVNMLILRNLIKPGEYRRFQPSLMANAGPADKGPKKRKPAVRPSLEPGELSPGNAVPIATRDDGSGIPRGYEGPERCAAAPGSYEPIKS